MSEIRSKSVVDYLRLMDPTVCEEHLKTIRDRYRQVLKLSNDVALPADPDEGVIEEVARQLNLQILNDEARDYLRDCVRYEDINDVISLFFAKLAGGEKPIDEDTLKTIVFSSPSPVRSAPMVVQVPPCTTQETILVTDIDCLLTIKMSTPEVHQFLHSFLLQNTEVLQQQSATTSASISVCYNEQFPLDNCCLLYLFICRQLSDRRIITSDSRRALASLRLTEPVSLADDFGTWTYDHWRGLFDLELSHHDTGTRFPPRWYLANNALIHCRILNYNSPGTMSSSSSKITPRTASLDVFVRDICAYENNGQETAWLKALRKEDILTYEHLTNLRQSAWDNIRALSMNARRILKAAIDRTRENIDSDRRQDIAHDIDREDVEHPVPNNPSKHVISFRNQTISLSELLANLHLIKLFVCHTLRGERDVQRRDALPKLEAECLDKVVDEMRNEGFADDGLFPKIAEFFLPLTISEQELCIEPGLDQQKRQTLMEDQKQLLLLIDKKSAVLDEQSRIFWTYDENIARLTEHRTRARNTYAQKRAELAAATNGEQQQQAQGLQKHDRQWQKEQADLVKEMKQEEELKRDLNKVIDDLMEEIEQCKARIRNIEIELTVSSKYIDKQLIKPARGLIMYGPPGTGKSEIMSKLAKKLGIVMIGSPLAAGELNRPYIGESERIIIALCQRCYRIPYAMCCVSIDEIDALAPKRDEDSSEGKVDKICVLLSLIEGIKDIPNLMILCATNRLHMMDEAFLRRMSGKFFVGRPSSDARTTILKSIPDFALEPEILDRLSIATTNFSGAAVRALTRTITVKCINARRTNPSYRIDPPEALKIADSTAQQYQILFGSETLPRLLLRNFLDGSRSHIHQLSNNFHYTGRIVIDLDRNCVRIEARTPRTNRPESPCMIIEHKLDPSEANVQSLLERLTNYGKNRNVQLLQLVDLNLLAAQGAYDEKKIFETLKDRYDECVAYNRSMIVFDLDALVGVNKSESDSNMGRSTSSSVVNQHLYTYVRARFRDCTIENKDQSADSKERWVVAVIREPFLLRQFCNDVQFTRTPEEEEELKLERRRAEDLLKCVKCKDFYIENENKMGNCVHHDGFIYDNAASDMTMHKPTGAVQLLNRIECDIITDADRRKELEREKNKFKWICCDAVLVSGNVGGCKKGKHGFNGSSTNEPQQGRLAETTTDRLDQDTIQQWEEACGTNEEYITKWLTLLQTRG